MSEWFKEPDSKSGVLKGTGGSNPSLSAALRAYHKLNVQEPHKSADILGESLPRTRPSSLE